MPEEFEVDLSIADEDSASQLYFIDLRLLFQPTSPASLKGWLRDEIEGRANDILRREGLDGCYHFLHDFVLSHKLNILKSQAYQLSRGHWSENIRIEAVHRSLVVQYWLTQPGGKNWIELGIRRQKNKHTTQFSAAYYSASIAIRWFRAAKEVTNTKIGIDLGNLSIESIIRKVISMHTDYIFEELSSKLRSGAIYSKRLLRLKHISRTLDPSLVIQLTASQTTTIVQEPISGKFVLLPASPPSLRVERDLNTLPSPGIDGASRIANFRALISQEEIESQARAFGWEIEKSIKPSQDTLKRLFPNETLRTGFFRRKSWHPGWLLACTSGLMGDVWWIVQSTDKKPTSDHPFTVGPILDAAFEIPFGRSKSLVPEPSITMLSQIERIAAGMISQYLDTRQLTKQNVRHKLLAADSSESGLSSPALHIIIPDFRIRSLLRSPTPLAIPWINEIVKISFVGVDPTTSSAVHIAVAKARATVPGIQSLGSLSGTSIAFHPTSGAFAFRLVNQVGSSTIPSLLQHLLNVECLLLNLSTIQKHECTCNSVSLDYLDFTYADVPSRLSAKVFFPSGRPTHLSFNHGNPHLRIQDQLSSLLQTTQELDQVIKLLRLTLPVMLAFSAIVAASQDDEITILPRSTQWYQIRYRNPKGRYDLVLRERRGSFMWLARNLELPRSQDGAGQAESALMKMTQPRSSSWSGIKGGVVASPNGTAAMITRLNEIIKGTGDVVPQETLVPHGKKRKAHDDDITVID